MKKNLYHIILILCFFSYKLFSQSFNLSEVDPSNYPLIKASFTAYDILGNPYNNLVPDDFSIYDNSSKIPVNLTFLHCTPDLPISVVLVIDKSSSMNDIVDGEMKWKWVIEGVKSFIADIDVRNESQIALTSFSTIFNLNCPFTRDKKEILDSVNKLPQTAYGGTNYNVAFLTPYIGPIDLLRTTPVNHRRVIVFLSDGKHDVQTEALRTQFIIDSLRNSNIQLYAITLLSPANAELQNICTFTSGKYYEVNTKTQLNDLYKKIAADANIKVQCELSWIAPDICDKSALIRKADITFLRQNSLKTRKYIADKNVIKKIIYDKPSYDFGDPVPNSYTERKIKITADNADFNITNIDILPSGYFSIVDWGDGSGVKPSFPFIMNLSESREITIRFLQTNPKKVQRATLVINTLPCDVNIPLIGGIQQVKVDKPLSTDIFSSCDTVVVRWSGIDPSIGVDLYYTTDDGNTWNLIVSKVTGLKYNWVTNNFNTKVKIRASVTGTSYYEWANQMMGTDYDNPSSCAVTKNDLYVYVSGSFRGLTTFNNKQVATSGLIDFYLAKYDSDGNLVWVNPGGDNNHNDYANGVCADYEGNAYLVGTTFKGVRFGNSLPGLQEDDKEYCFLAKYNDAGQYIKSTFIGAYNYYKNFRAWGNKVMIRQLPDDFPYIYVYGTYLGEYQDLDRDFILPIKTSPSTFTAVYDMNLELVNLYAGGLDYPSYSSNVSIDNYGTKYTVGSFKNKISFGKFTLTSKGDFDGYLTKFSSVIITADSTENFRISKPTLKFVQNPYDFGELILGDSSISKTKNFIYNDGYLPITITKDTITGNNADNFIIIDTLKNKTINPGDSLDIKIKFKTNNLGMHQASLKLDANCMNQVNLDLIGIGICGGRALDTFYFSDQNLFKTYTDTLKCAFYNESNFAILCTPQIRGANFTDFILSFPENVKVNFGQVVVMPYECLDIIITFTPKALGLREAYINFNVKSPCKNVSTQLRGIGISADVTVNKVNWGEKRINGKYFDKITIKNNSAITEKILSIDLENNDGIFNFTKPQLPLIIKADSSVTIDVEFNPTNETYYENNLLIYPEIKAEQLKANLIGIGILPKLNTEWICGETVNVGDSTIAFIKLTNPSISSDLKINQIEIQKKGLEYQWSSGVEPQNMILPKTESITIPVKYKPQLNSDHKNNIIIYADNYDATYKNEWFVTNVPTICDGLEIKYTTPINFNDNIVCSEHSNSVQIENSSKASNITLFLSKAKLIGKDYQAFNININSDKDLIPDEKFNFDVIFTPYKLGKHEAQLLIPNSTNNDILISLFGNGLSLTPYTNPTDLTFEPGASYTVPFIIQIPNIENNTLNKFDVWINYNQYAYKFVENSFKTNISNNSTNSEFLNWSNPDLSVKGEIRLSATGKLNDNQKIELFSLTYSALLTDQHETELFYGVDFSCFNEKFKVANVKVNEVCNNDTRLITLGDAEFYLSDINPNPVSNYCDINFTLGFKVDTKFEIINSVGEIVLSPEFKSLSAGKHTMKFDFNKLSNGVYIIRMDSGPYTSWKKLIINK